MATRFEDLKGSLLGGNKPLDDETREAIAAAVEAAGDGEQDKAVRRWLKEGKPAPGFLED